MKELVSVTDLIGKRVLTNTKLEPTTGYLVAERHLNARRPHAVGIVTGYVPGHGGDVYWVRHSEGPSSNDPSPVAAYMFTEFEFAEK